MLSSKTCTNYLSPNSFTFSNLHSPISQSNPMKINTFTLVFSLLLAGPMAYSQDSTTIARPDTAVAKAKKPTASLYVQGQRQAERYYQKYTGAGTGTLITSLVSPLVGLIPAIACSSTTPKEANLGYPKAELFAQEPTFPTTILEFSNI